MKIPDCIVEIKKDVFVHKMLSFLTGIEVRVEVFEKNKRMFENKPI